MKIGVSGASGKLGRKVLSELLAHGGNHDLVGISRSPEAVLEPAEGRLGDYDKPDLLVRAYEGLDRLLIIPSADLRPGVRSGQLKAAIDAARHVGVEHVVLMSAVGTREAAEPSLGATYWAGEQHLIRTASRWTVLRMNYYAETMANEIKSSLDRGVLAGLGFERVAYVSRNDVAAAAAGILSGEGHAGAIYNATGSCIVTGEERAALVSEFVGKPSRFSHLTKEQLHSGLAQASLPEYVANAIVEIKSNFIAGDFDIVTGDVTRLTGKVPTQFRDILAAELNSDG